MTQTENAPVVGIDLGTTRSVIAHLDQLGRPVTIENAEGETTTPSVVFFDKTGPVVGREALKMAAIEPDRVARYAKRDIGRNVYHDMICGEYIPPEVIEATILHKLRKDASLKLEGIRKAVVTVPAFFNEPRRRATQDAGRLAGLTVIDIINEPTAAAIAFGIANNFLSADGAAVKKETILVYDLGGGTFDVTLMDIEGGRYTTIATAGDVHLGGIDWDQRIVSFVAERVREALDFDPTEDPIARQRLMREAEEAKHALTARESTTILFEHGGQTAKVELSRAEFETSTGDLLERTLFTVRSLLREAGVTWEDITRLLLVGGSTRMPMIYNSLADDSGLTPDRSLSPDEAVAHGAAIYAALVADTNVKTPRIVVQNVNSHDLGVLGTEPETGRPRRRVLIPRNTPIPAEGTGIFATKKVDQRRVVVKVVEGGDATGKNATPIGKCIVEDLPENLPVQTPVEVRFHYEANGCLKIEAHLPDAKRMATLTIERAAGLPESKLQVWLDRIENGLKIGLDTITPPPVQTPDPEAMQTGLDLTRLGPITTPEKEQKVEDIFTGDDFDDLLEDL